MSWSLLLPGRAGLVWTCSFPSSTRLQHQCYWVAPALKLGDRDMDPHQPGRNAWQRGRKCGTIRPQVVQLREVAASGTAGWKMPLGC